MPVFDPATTALVMIDLQKGILATPRSPHASDAVVARAQALAQRFRAAKAPVVWVRVGFSADFADAPRQPVDQPLSRQGVLPPDWSALAPGLDHPGDLHILKRQWGAFYGTELDLQLRRRGVRTIVLGGVATNFGVESTARDAWEHGYAVVIVEDACSTVSPEMHDFAIHQLFPRIARVTTTTEVAFESH